MTISDAEYEYLQSCREYAEADRGVILLSGGVSAADHAFVAFQRDYYKSQYESTKLENWRLTKENEYLQNRNKILEEMDYLSKHRIFGPSSEAFSDPNAVQLCLYREEPRALPAPRKSPQTRKADPERPRKSGSAKDVVPKGAEVEVVEHTLPEEERKCPQCGRVMEDVGTEEKWSTVFVPARVYLRQDIYHNYRCKYCEENDIHTEFKKTTKEPALISGGYSTPEAVAYIAYQKFVMGTPLYRLEKELELAHISLSRQTMSNWLNKCSEKYLQPVYDVLHGELLKHDLLHADETTFQVLREPERPAQSKSYMWLYRTSGDAEQPIVLYEYQPGRRHEFPAKFLQGFHGYLQTDGYSAYHGLEGVVNVGCFAHVRRKFFEAVKAVPEGQQSPAATEGLAYCNKLFELEEEFRELDPENRKKARQEHSKPALDAMLSWAETRSVPPKSTLGGALTYLLNQWPTLTVFLEDGRIELSNNRAERSIKPFVIARKNFLFANTPRGARSTAVWFSLIESAKENGVDPYKYLIWVLQESLNKKQPRDLLPWVFAEIEQ